MKMKAALPWTTAACILMSLAESTASDFRALTFEKLTISPTERITGFEITIRPATLSSMPTTPVGWYMSIDNQASWEASIKGGILVGAAAIDEATLNSMFVVREDKTYGIPLCVEGEIIVTEDFERDRHIAIGTGNVVLRDTDILATGGK